MTDRVLMDMEIALLWRRSDAPPDPKGPVAFGRAVEQAVLAKVRHKEGRYEAWMDAYVRVKAKDGRFVPESEVRERERKAWDAAIDYDHGTLLRYRFKEMATLNRDRLYPSLWPKEVTGPSGKRYRMFTLNKETFLQSWYGDDLEWCREPYVPSCDAPTVAKLMAEP